MEENKDRPYVIIPYTPEFEKEQFNRIQEIFLQSQEEAKKEAYEKFKDTMTREQLEQRFDAFEKLWKKARKCLFKSLMKHIKMSPFKNPVPIEQSAEHDPILLDTIELEKKKIKKIAKTITPMEELSKLYTLDRAQLNPVMIVEKQDGSTTTSVESCQALLDESRDKVNTGSIELNLEMDRLIKINENYGVKLSKLEQTSKNLKLNSEMVKKTWDQGFKKVKKEI